MYKYIGIDIDLSTGIYFDDISTLNHTINTNTYEKRYMHQNFITDKSIDLKIHNKPTSSCIDTKKGSDFNIFSNLGSHL